MILAIDPGYEQSAFVGYHDKTVEFHYTMPNTDLLDFLRASPDWATGTLVIEKVEAMGMAVGREVFETVFIAGRFAEAWHPASVHRLGRRAIKLHLCGHARATDANIRQAIIDRFGPTKAEAIGTKKAPGPLYGLKGHEYAALAVALTYSDQLVGQTAPESEMPF